MSTGSVTTSGTTPLSFSGLSSGLNTSAIIQALLAAERQPINQLTNQQEKLVGQQSQLQTLQTSLTSLTFAASEFTLPSLFEGTQAVSSSEPARIAASISGGAGVGGYEVEVTQLASSAQRSYTFVTPAAEDTITIGGREYAVKAGATAKEVAAKINGDGKGTVFAAVQGEGTIVLSSRATGLAGGEAITVADPGGTLTEKAGTAKAGKDAAYSVDGVAGTSSSNTVTAAIPGVTLTFAALTSAGPVTIAVQPPAPSVKAIESQLESFVKLYNSTVEAIETQLATKPPANPKAGEFATGSLFGDTALSGVLAQMRRAMYEPIAGLPAEMSSPLSLGVSTGAATTGKSTQSSLVGVLKLDPAKLASAIQANPEGAKTMMQKWAHRLNEVVNNVAGPGGALDTRISGDVGQIREMKLRIDNMNQMLSVRQKALEQTYARLEQVMARNSAQSSWLTQQSEQLSKSGL
jgi:flagellar hook-associated protein 2